jgi:hypothetical protein
VRNLFVQKRLFVSRAAAKPDDLAPPAPYLKHAWCVIVILSARDTRSRFNEFSVVRVNEIQVSLAGSVCYCFILIYERPAAQEELTTAADSFLYALNSNL